MHRRRSFAALAIALTALAAACTATDDTQGPPDTPEPTDGATPTPTEPDGTATPPGSATPTPTPTDVATPVDLRVTTPADGTTVGGAFDFTVTAEGTFDVIELRAGEVAERLDTPPFTLRVDTRPLADGDLVLEARALRGAAIAAIASVTVQVDNTGPTITPVAPLPGAALVAPFHFRVEAADRSGVAQVELFVGAESLVVRETPPYAVEIDPTLRPGGAATLRAVGIDGLGNVAEASVVVVFDDGPPVVRITAPGTGTDLTEPFEVRVEATDASGIDHVTLIINAAEVASLDAGPYTFPLDPIEHTDGRKLIEARAFDVFGNMASAEIQVDFIHPDDGGGNGGDPPPPADEDRDYLVDSITLAHSTEGFDLDGDGAADNAAYTLLTNPLITNQVGDVDGNMAAAIANGAMLMVMATEALDDFTTDDFLWLDVYLAQDSDDPPDPSDNFSGTEELVVDPQSLDENGDPYISFPRAHVEDGVLAAGPGDFVFVFPLTMPPTRIEARNARITADVAADGLTNGLIGGAVPVDLLIEAILAIPEVQAQPGVAGLIRSLLPAFADIDLTGDGRPDAMSMAIHFTATTAVLEGQVVRDDGPPGGTAGN